MGGLTESLMRAPALSLWQPWATLLARGDKRFETRGWSTRYRGLMLIHAARQWSLRMAKACYEEPFFSILSAGGTVFPARCDAVRLARLGLPFGAIVAIAELVDVVPTEGLELSGTERAFGDFRHGRYAFLYSNLFELEPIPCRGEQGLFRVPREVRTEVARRLERAGQWQS